MITKPCKHISKYHKLRFWVPEYKGQMSKIIQFFVVEFIALYYLCPAFALAPASYFAPIPARIPVFTDPFTNLIFSLKW